MNDFNFFVLLITILAHVMGQAKAIDAPVIGILAVDVGKKEHAIGNSTFLASYVYTLLSAGAKVIPIPLGLDMHTYRKLFNKINGLLVPGGYVSPFTSKAMMTLQLYIHWATLANRQGDYFPIWGTCLGFEMLVLSFINSTDVLQRCNVQNELLTIDRTKYFRYSSIFRHAPQSMLNAMQQEPVAPNFHRWCLTEESLQKADLEHVFMPTTSSHSSKRQMTFIESIEHAQYPFYGIAWHPEKNVYEYNDSLNLSKSDTAQQLAHYLARFFVNEAKKSTHTFESTSDFEQYSIFNYCPKFMGKEGFKYGQAYFF